MNELELYQFHYLKIHSIAKRIFKLKFKEAYEKGRPYSYVFNLISPWFKDEIDKKFTFRLLNEYPKAYKIFDNRNSYYRGDKDEVIEKILIGEVYDCFKGERGVLYRLFIVDLAIEKALRDIQNHFFNYRSYYDLVYSTGGFDYITLNYYEFINFEQSEGYKKMQAIKSPNKINKDEQNVVSKSKKKKEMVEESIINSFTDDERMLIISIFYDLISKNNTSEIQLTGLIKLVKIIGAYEDLSIFKKKPSELTMYKKAQNGFGYYDSKMGVIKLIDSTLLKLESFDLKFISERLSIQRVKLKNELNKK